MKLVVLQPLCFVVCLFQLCTVSFCKPTNQMTRIQEVFRTLMGAKPMMIDSRGKKSSFSPINEQMISDIERRLYVKDADQQQEALVANNNDNNYVYENIDSLPQQEAKPIGGGNNNPSNIYRPVIWLQTTNDDLERF